VSQLSDPGNENLMKLATVRTMSGTAAAMVDDESVSLLSYDDAGSALRSAPMSALGQARTGIELGLDEVTFAPVIPEPTKIICVGLNYRDHVEEMGRELPTAPTCFAKFAGALIGASDTVEMPAADVSNSVDWEVELTVVIGSPVRNATANEAMAAIAGYTVLNDVSMRDWQTRSIQFLAGKTWEHCTPVGPWVVGKEVLGDGSGLGVSCEVNGITKQSSNTDNLVFGAVDLVQDLSKVITLEPGDLIATGTPGGVGAGRDPKEFLQDGDVLTTTIEGIGTLINPCRRA
ncbi:MAG: fumarylacetoacetate hydrolase family protein, partial [Acidimicrobiia bacterium]